MKYLTLILITLLCVISTQLFGQNTKIDSLNKVIATTKVDTVKGRTLGRLSWQMKIVGDMENALKKGEEGLKICERAKDERGVAICLNNIGVIYEDQGNYPKALDFYQSSLKIFEKVGNQKGVTISLNSIGRIYDFQGNYPKALDFYQKASK